MSASKTFSVTTTTTRSAGSSSAAVHDSRATRRSSRCPGRARRSHLSDLTSWTEQPSRPTGAAMSPGQLRKLPPVVDLAAIAAPVNRQFRPRRVYGGRRERIGGRAARRFDRETAGTRHGRGTGTAHPRSCRFGV
jgi:hypothetical protein